MKSRFQRPSTVDFVIFSLLAWLPPLLTSRGQVSADTKSYLYLDPARVLREATSMWNPNIGNGTVTHQMLGYLWPMGPFFRVFDAIGTPDWVAQRLWWGLLVFCAAWGTRRLALSMGSSRSAASVAAAMYAFSPYFLQYFARLSGLLMPWAGLPWLMWCVYRGRADSSWKWPACFALIVGTVGTVNATSLIMVGVGPLLWLIADVVSKTSTVRRTLVFAFRTGILCLGVCVWWLVGLLIQGSYGLPILRYTESYETVAKASSPQELLRGLGYWFFYGGDKLGRWVGPSVPYLTRPIVMLAGWTACGLALLSLSLVRSRHKFHLVFVLVCALGIAVGAAPLSSPSPYGRIFDVIVHNESGFALRSTPRAAPVVLLMLALSLAFGLDRLRVVERVRRVRPSTAFAFLSVTCIIVNFHPWFLLSSTTPSIMRESTLPTYWTELAKTLNDESVSDDLQHPQRTYEMPGSDFANYTWGGTIDPITPGLVKGGYIARELVPYGSDSTADLLNSYESRLQEGWYESGTLADFAEFISATNVVLRNDLQHERYRTPRPEILWRLLRDEHRLTSMYEGQLIPASSYMPIVDNSTYGSSAVDQYPAVVAWKAVDPRPLLTVTPLTDVVVMSGSGDGIVDSLGAGVVSSSSTIVYRETLRLRQLDQFDDSNRAVVTDSNRKAPRRWFSVGSNLGRVERADETVADDPTDNRLMPFVSDPNVTPSTDSQTVSYLKGDIAAITATSFGNQVTYTPEDRPENAFDANPFTAWRAGVFSTTTGQSITAELRRVVSPPSVSILQSSTGVTVRRIERFQVTLRNRVTGDSTRISGNFNGRTSVTVDTKNRQFDTITFEVLSDSFGKRTDYAAAPGIGIAEIVIPGVENSEYLRVPVDSKQASPTFVFTRRRIDASTPNRFDPDDVLRRLFTTRAASEYRLSGKIRINPYAGDSTIAALIGQEEPSYASAKSDGNILASGLNARDGAVDTAWISPIDNPAGSRLTTNFGNRGDSTFTLVVRTGPMYSLPRQVLLRTTDQSIRLDLPEPSESGNITVSLPEALDGPIREVTISAIREKTFPDYFSNAPRVLPFAISEMYTAARAGAPSRVLSDACRTDILAIDGKPIPVRLSGDPAALLIGGAADIELCDSTLSLIAGEHTLGPARDNVSPWITGWNIDRVVLTPAENVGNSDSVGQVATVDVRKVSSTKLSADVVISTPSVLAFAESINRGWKATLLTPEGTINLGEPFVVNGYANGWIVPQSGQVLLEWTPQQSVMPAFLISLLSFLVCIGLLFVRRSSTTTVPITETDTVERTKWWIVPLILFVFAGPLPGLMGAIGAFLRPRWSTLLGVLIGGGTVSWIVASQWYYRWPPNLDWPGRFSSVTWLALAFLTVAGARETTTVET